MPNHKVLNLETLLLLPTAKFKLQAQWQGPYEILKPIGKVNYLVHLHGQRKKQMYTMSTFMLRKWHTSESKSYFVQGVPEKAESHKDEIPVRYPQ